MIPWNFTMVQAQQEEGWPLGLQRLNRSLGLARSFNLSGSISFSTLLSSPTTSSSLCSFDLHTEETEGATLGRTRRLSRRLFTSSFRVISGVNDGFGIMSPLPPPQQQQQQSSHRIKKKLKNWLCSLCSKPASDDEDNVRMTKMLPLLSLGYLLEEERRAMKHSQNIR